MAGASDSYITRFSLYRIIEHWTHAVIFVSLVVTGFSQKFYYLDISQWFVICLGGIDTVRLVHRAAGALLGIAIGQHLVVNVFGVLLKKWDPSMMVARGDFADAVTDIKYYLGILDSPARHGRYDYRQKFEYWGMLTGSMLMCVTGLALWFPVQVTRLLPGELIPAAKVLHTNGALILMLLIAVWHIYNVIFSPEVFPLDTVMFTGKISKERMMTGHALEYRNSFGSGNGTRQGEAQAHSGSLTEDV